MLHNQNQDGNTSRAGRAGRPGATAAARRLLRWLTLSLALGLPLALVGCEGNNPYKMSSVYPESDYAHQIQWLYQLIFFLSIPVVIVVFAALGYTLWRFRARPGDELPPQIHGNTRLEIAWTLAPAVILAIMAVPTVQTIFAGYKPVTTGNQMPIEIIGHQFWWEVRYPTMGGVVTANEIHLPVGQPVVLNMTSHDVLHSFWVPRLGGKKTVAPNFTTQIFFTAEKVGEYYGQCGEFCGESHANMRVRVFTQTPADFQAWVQAQLQPAKSTLAQGDADRGQVLFQQRTCATCHVVSGLPYTMQNVGPNLTHLGSRTTLASGLLKNNAEDLYSWIENPQYHKPGNIMPVIAMTPQERQDLVAYLLSLK